MSLAEAPNNIKLKVSGINACEESRRKLFSIGIFINDFVSKQNASKKGLILLRNLTNGSSKIALDRAVAHEIFVEYAG